MNVTSDGAWYVVQTKVNAEAKAGRNLIRQGFEIYLPRYLKRRSHARKIEKVAAPLFPRYLFVSVDMAKQRWRSNSIYHRRVAPCDQRFGSGAGCARGSAVSARQGRPKRIHRDGLPAFVRRGRKGQDSRRRVCRCRRPVRWVGRSRTCGGSARSTRAKSPRVDGRRHDCRRLSRLQFEGRPANGRCRFLFQSGDLESPGLR